MDGRASRGEFIIGGREGRLFPPVVAEIAIPVVAQEVVITPVVEQSFTPDQQ